MESCKNISKPISVLRVEFIKDIMNLINSSSLPAYVIEPILKDIHNDIVIVCKKQYELDLKEYENNVNNK